jgi:hypothetical protein
VSLVTYNGSIKAIKALLRLDCPFKSSTVFEAGEFSHFTVFEAGEFSHFMYSNIRVLTLLYMCPSSTVFEAGMFSMACFCSVHCN